MKSHFLPRSALTLVVTTFLLNNASPFKASKGRNKCKWNVGLTNTVQPKIQSRLFSAHPSEQHEMSLLGLVDSMLEAQKEISNGALEIQNLAESQCHDPAMPILGSDGVYRILNVDQLHNFQSAHADKLVILKFSSPICKACRELKQKFRNLDQAPEFVGKPLVVADIVVSSNKGVPDPFRDYITLQLNVHKIPSLQFYSAGTHLIDTVGCDPETGCSWSKIKQQMIQFVRQWAPKLQTEERTLKNKHSIPEIVSADVASIDPIQTAEGANKTLLQAFQSRFQKFMFQHQD
jgi:thiol-disulfide isomerase/thioredoxin